jgi:hypothetical protein
MQKNNIPKPFWALRTDKSTGSEDIYTRSNTIYIRENRIITDVRNIYLSFDKLLSKLK